MSVRMFSERQYYKDFCLGVCWGGGLFKDLLEPELEIGVSWLSWVLERNSCPLEEQTSALKH